VLHPVCNDNDPCTKDTCSIGDCDVVTRTYELVADDCVNLTFDGPCAYIEDIPGGFLCRHDDDDNGDDSADKGDTGPTLGEDDLRPITMFADGSMTGTLTLSVVTGATHGGLNTDVRWHPTEAWSLALIDGDGCCNAFEAVAKFASCGELRYYAGGTTLSFVNKDDVLKVFDSISWVSGGSGCDCVIEQVVLSYPPLPPNPPTPPCN